MSTDTTGIKFTNRLYSPNSSSTPSSPPSSSVGVELPFQTNEPVGHQSSSPPHSYRHSRAYRHFKNPPQPHMCIKVNTINGEELFINVLSWTRIVIPQEPSDPIPLYGGMRVPPGSPRSPPLVYAVMANPEVLKDSGRHSKDPEERSAMVELMCDFVEAMNPDVKLTRNAVILKDRDISGELKDVWNAVQAQRDREREEQLSQQHQQQQQQHYHNMPPHQIYLPKSPQYLQQQQVPPLPNQQYHVQAQNNNSSKGITTDNKILYSDIVGLETGHKKDNKVPQNEKNSTVEENLSTSVTPSAINNIEDNSNNLKENKSSMANIETNKKLEGNEKDVTDSNDSVIVSLKTSNEVLEVKEEEYLKTDTTDIETGKKDVKLHKKGANTIHSFNGNSTNIKTSTTTNSKVTGNNSLVTTTATTLNNSTAVSSSTTTSVVNTNSTNNTTTTIKEKKEKLGGFLPNGCHSIFPRFKNNKHKDKDKDKDKDKETKSNHSKEKTLLNSFKKSSNSASNAFNNKSQQDDSKSQYEKNCINLENEVEKLDLNKIDSPANEVLIKLKVASSGAK